MNMRWYFIFLIFVVNFDASSELKNKICSGQKTYNYIIKHHTFFNSEPISINSNMVSRFTKFHVKSRNECLQKCCQSKKCSAISITKNVCILLHCKLISACKPVKKQNLDTKNIYIVLMKLHTENIIGVKSKNSSSITIMRNSNSKESSMFNSATKVIFANAGPDLSIIINNRKTSPLQHIISIHGSASDKKGFILFDSIEYKWKRDPLSLAFGSILNHSDHGSSLMLTDLISGNYTFVLTVTDRNGFNSSDSVNIYVREKEDLDLINLIDIALDVDAYNFIEQNLIDFSKKMGHIIENDLLFNNCQIYVKSVSTDYKNRTLITFNVKCINSSTKEINVVSAQMLEDKFKIKLISNKLIFNHSVLKFQSRVCFNDCGGNGKCKLHNHRCECNFPWVNNPWHERNTDLHILAIIIISTISIISFLSLLLLLKTIAKRCLKGHKQLKEMLRYKLLDNNHEG